MSAPVHHKAASGRVDHYLAAMPSWSREICEKLRALVLSVSPGITEDWKWGPHYYYEGMLCGFGAFKNHVSFVFFRGAELEDVAGIFQREMGGAKTRRLRFTAMEQVKVTLLKKYIREAMRINKSMPKPVRAVKAPAVLHPDFAAALTRRKLHARFEVFAPYRKREIAEWISSAKREETRIRRIEAAIALVSNGKSINDKYRSRK